MKRIEATIPPFKLEAIRDALLAAGIDGMTMTEVKVLDPQVRAACYRGASYGIQFTPRCKLEVVVPNEQVERCVRALQTLLAGGLAAAEIVVQALDDSVRIRTGEHFSRAA